MTSIPTSGVFLRAFAGVSMTAGARHVAEVLAASVSYDGKYRGAPKGCAAFTMGELQRATGLAARTIRAAIAELVRLFGLVIIRRHHQRHFFRFTRIGRQEQTATPAAPRETAQTGSRMPVSPYTREQRNNDCSQRVRIGTGESVYRTPWAGVIERFKRGTPAEGVDTQFLWNGFCGLNRRNGHDCVPLRFLIGFLRKYPAKRARSTPMPAQGSRPAMDRTALHLAELARPAPFRNRHWHKADLQRKIGPDAYAARVAAMIERHGTSRFIAELAVHGEAVRGKEIDR